MREERQAPKNDPRAEHPCGDSEEEDLDQAPLDKRQLERLEHDRRLSANEIDSHYRPG
jgi:hypothetical protein